VVILSDWVLRMYDKFSGYIWWYLIWNRSKNCQVSSVLSLWWPRHEQEIFQCTMTNHSAMMSAACNEGTSICNMMLKRGNHNFYLFAELWFWCISLV
jgi:hypothetical protein